MGAAKKSRATDDLAGPAAVRLVPIQPAKGRPARTVNDISHQAAQAELNAALFPHYLLGRQLALEETVRELLLALPEPQRDELVDKLRFQADQAIERLQDGIADANEDASTCGYVCTLLQQGM